MQRTEKNGTVDSVRRTYKLCCYSNTLNFGHAVFACYENTSAVHSENPFMVSKLTTGNSGQLKMSPKFHTSQKRMFWIWPNYIMSYITFGQILCVKNILVLGQFGLILFCPKIVRPKSFSSHTISSETELRLFVNQKLKVPQYCDIPPLITDQ